MPDDNEIDEETCFSIPSGGIPLVVLEPSALTAHRNKPIMLARRTQVYVDKVLMVEHAAEATRSGIELVDIALGIARDPAAENADRLKAIAWLADRMLGSVTPANRAQEVNALVNLEKQKMVAALRAALSETDVARIEAAMIAQGASLEKKKNRGGRPIGQTRWEPPEKK